MASVPPPQKPVTSTDVAKAAGVSRTTVSLVLNGVESIALSPQTRDHVRAVARDLGYVPHSGARALRKGYSGIVLMPSADGALGRLVLEWTTELEDALNAVGLTFVTFGSRHLGYVDAARAWSQLRPVAVLTLGSVVLPARSQQILRDNGTRAIVSTGEGPAPGTHVLVTGQADAGALAATHLADTGRRRVGIVLPTEAGLEGIARARRERAISVCEARGIETVDLPMRYDRDGALAVARTCVERGIDGVFAYDDDYALLLLSALDLIGVAVPRDVAVVGCDDIVAGTLARPALTTVRLSFPAAREVADVIRRLLEDPDAEPGVSRAEPPRLIVRDSS